MDSIFANTLSRMRAPDVWFTIGIERVRPRESPRFSDFECASSWVA